MKRRSRISGGLRLFCLLAMLMAYLAILSYGLFFAEGMDRSLVHGTYNLVPFHEIGRVIRYADVLGWQFVAINLGGNILAFLPLGFLTAAIWSEEKLAFTPALVILTFLFSSTVESLQYLTSVGVADVDDVILNTIGGFLGCEMDHLCKKFILQIHRIPAIPGGEAG
ncbi:MAG: VanZ family protein [Lachnospiraceae bacterium]|nr:VanZ family protein [Lachnospiraceae bacterium]